MKSLVEIKNFLAPSSKYDDQKFEFIFVLDRSGSMEGNKILLARRALALFLRSLPTNCMFNVIGFGSDFDKLFPNSVPYTEKTLEFALNYANRMNADLGCTELFRPLENLYFSTQYPGYLTQIFVLTDGAVHDFVAVMDLISRRKQRCRVFSLGIGQGASRSLVDGVANVGGGTSIYALDNEKIETKILQQLKIALQPSLLKAVPVLL